MENCLQRPSPVRGSIRKPTRKQNISAWIVSGRGGAGCSAAVGYSILNRTSNIDVGSLMLKYNGGGHKKVGTCQFSDDTMKTELPKMLAELCEMANK